jgi:hypothetical protein
MYNMTTNGTMAAYNVTTVSGFSLTNRWLLYTSIMLAPAQFISGVRSNFPANLGFLAYNWYTQISWHQSVAAKQLNALCLLPVHFNTMYSLSYLGGVTSGNIVMGILLGFGTAGVMVLNNVTAWTSWATNQPEGYGEYQFFFFGWRTLDANWHKFFLVWQIFDSLEALTMLTIAISLAIAVTGMEDEEFEEWSAWWMRYPFIPLGAVVMLVLAWPLILWVELIVARNNIESATDYIAVWLFVAQVVAMLIPMPF